jgi:hypothetical protein
MQTLETSGSRAAIRGRVVELGAVQQAAVHRRHDLGSRQRVYRRAQAGKDVDRQSNSAVLHSLEVVGFVIRFLNQPSGCVIIGP